MPPAEQSSGWGRRTFRALGGGVELVVHRTGRDAGDSTLDAVLDAGEATVRSAEARWSRFRPDSVLARLNQEGTGTVDEATMDLLVAAREAWRRTDGRVDPTVLPALEAAGYDRSFEHLVTDGAAPGPEHPGRVPRPGPDDRVPRPAPGLTGLVLDPATGHVALPEGAALDLGGIGKGRAADLTAAALLDAGATGACANLGGDVRVAGTGPDEGGWRIGIEDPRHPARRLATVRLADGAVATSSTLGRAWWRDGRPAHHLIEPSTGRPSSSDVDAAVVVAGDATWAEVLAKAAILAGSAWAEDLLVGEGVAGLLVGPSFGVRAVGGLDAYLEPERDEAVVA